jgi:hypothetical protein
MKQDFNFRDIVNNQAAAALALRAAQILGLFCEPAMA